MDKRDWTEGIPELMQNYSEAEPEGLWDAVRAGMEKPRRRIAAAWWYAGGVLAAAAVVVLALLVWPVRPEGISIVPGDAVAQHPAEEVAADRIAEADFAVAPASRAQIEPVLCTEPEKTEVGAQIGPLLCTEPEKGEVRQQTEPVLTTEPEKGEVRQQTEQLEQTVVKERMRKKINRPRIIDVQALISASGLTAQNVSSVRTGFGIPVFTGTRAMSTATGSADVPMLSRNKASTTVTSHSQSARFAIGLKVGLYPGWGLETGVVATTLNSEFTTSTGSAQSYTERKLNYLGVPLYLHWSALDWGRLNLYACGGPMLEFCTSAETITGTTLDGMRMREGTDNSPVKERLWSLNVGAGAQLRVFENGYLFVQPGFSYHFKGGSTIESFYTERPAAFNLTVGYRVVLF